MEFITTLPMTFIPIFIAIDIFAVLPIFISLTEDMPEEGKKRVISQSVITAFAVGAIFIAVGGGIFKVLRITADDFKVAGGMLLLVFAVHDLTRLEKKPIPSDMAGVVPIGVPLIVGPAVLTTVMVLVEHYGTLATIVSLVVNLVLVWACFVGAERITKYLGRNGIIALSKIMALLLASIAVMMMRIGLTNIIKNIGAGH